MHICIKRYIMIQMKAGIYYNKNRLSLIERYLKPMMQMLEEYSCSCTVVKDGSNLDGLDVLFVLGGDGTILNIASECALRGIKILGINYGHLGFLAEFEPEKYVEAVKLVCDGNYVVNRRAMLEICCKGKTYLALNDLVVQRSTGLQNFSNTVELRAEIDGITVDNYLSDGIIVSTPTGSTAYSLSAGGSILTPDLSAFIMTPICAHSLHSRPVVFNDNSVLRIEPKSCRSALNLVVDGKIVDVIDLEVIKVKKSKYFVEFITRGDKDFFKKLLIKLNKWSK